MKQLVYVLPKIILKKLLPFIWPCSAALIKLESFGLANLILEKLLKCYFRKKVYMLIK